MKRLLMGVVAFATAAYGSYLAPEVKLLRAFRDEYLLTNALGKSLVAFYYDVSPPVAEYIASHEAVRVITRLLLTPIVYAVKYPLWAFLLVISLPVLAVLGLRLRSQRGVVTTEMSDGMLVWNRFIL